MPRGSAQNRREAPSVRRDDAERPSSVPRPADHEMPATEWPQPRPGSESTSAAYEKADPPLGEGPPYGAGGGCRTTAVGTACSLPRHAGLAGDPAWRPGPRALSWKDSGWRVE
jgi:hypothetical protein